MAQVQSTSGPVQSVARFVKYAVLSVMATAWTGFWSLIVYSNVQAGNHSGAVVIATLLLVIPAVLLARRVRQIRATGDR